MKSTYRITSTQPLPKDLIEAAFGAFIQYDKGRSCNHATILQCIFAAPSLLFIFSIGERMRSKHALLDTGPCCYFSSSDIHIPIGSK
jgi:hypothetical protein